jgi:hypothetical protein
MEAQPLRDLSRPRDEEAQLTRYATPNVESLLTQIARALRLLLVPDFKANSAVNL